MKPLWLYGTATILLDKTTIKNLDLVENLLYHFVSDFLGCPRSSFRKITLVATNTDLTLH